jgi:hypothetical protein
MTAWLERPQPRRREACCEAAAIPPPIKREEDESCRHCGSSVAKGNLATARELFSPLFFLQGEVFKRKSFWEAQNVQLYLAPTTKDKDFGKQGLSYIYIRLPNPRLAYCSYLAEFPVGKTQK